MPPRNKKTKVSGVTRNNESPAEVQDFQHGANLVGTTVQQEPAVEDDEVDEDDEAAVGSAPVTTDIVARSVAFAEANGLPPDSKYLVIGSNGKPTLLYEEITIDALPSKVEMKFFNPMDYKKIFERLLSLASTIHVQENNDLRTRAQHMYYLHSILEPYKMEVFMYPIKAEKLDYSNLVVKCQAQIFEELVQKILPRTSFLIVKAFPFEEISRGFTTAVNELWEGYKIFNSFDWDRYIHEPTMYRNLCYYARVAFAEQPTRYNNVENTIYNFLVDSQDLTTIREKFQAAHRRKLQTLENLEFIKFFCTAFYARPINEKGGTRLSNSYGTHRAPYAMQKVEGSEIETTDQPKRQYQDNNRGRGRGGRGGYRGYGRGGYRGNSRGQSRGGRGGNYNHKRDRNQQDDEYYYDENQTDNNSSGTYDNNKRENRGDQSRGRSDYRGNSRGNGRGRGKSNRGGRGGRGNYQASSFQSEDIQEKTIDEAQNDPSYLRQFAEHGMGTD